MNDAAPLAAKKLLERCRICSSMHKAKNKHLTGSSKACLVARVMSSNLFIPLERVTHLLRTKTSAYFIIS